MKWAGHRICTEETRYRYKILVARPHGKIPFGRIILKLI
jgi:hypothetical protein